MVHVHHSTGARRRPSALDTLFTRGFRTLLATLISGVLIGLALATASPAAAATGADVVLTWGRNAYGQLGTGTTVNSSLPEAAHLPAGTTVTALAAGYGHSVALTSTGQVLAWGDGRNGQLGDGSFASSLEPVSVQLPAGATVTAIASGDDFALALTSAGQVLSWGYNEWGQLGDGNLGEDSDVPVAVHLPADTTVIAISAGAGHALALTATGEVLGWGDNDFGQVGDGTRISRDVPVEVHLPPGATARAIAGGDDHSLALTTTGTVLAWGYNGQGQLGNGTTTTSATPVTAAIPADQTVTGIAAAHGFQSFAITATGLLAWGDNTNGQLGDGTTTRRTTPVAVHLPTGTIVTAVAGGDDHTVALTSAGEVLAWGYNRYGQLGDGSTVNSSDPIAVDLPGGGPAYAVGAGNYHSLAVTRGPSSSTTLTAEPPATAVGHEVTLTATVTCSSGEPAEGEVRFVTSHGRLIGTAALHNGVATLTTSDLDEGEHTIVAEYAGTPTCPESGSEDVTVTITAEQAGTPTPTESETATETPTPPASPSATATATSPAPAPSPHATKPGGSLPATGAAGITTALIITILTLVAGSTLLILRKRQRH